MSRASSRQTHSYRERRGKFPDAERVAGKRIMLYGLTANPPTGDGGHRGIVKYMAKLNVCDEIWVLPVFRHIYASKSYTVEFEHRLRMCELNFRFSAEVDEHGQLERLTPVIVLDLEKTLNEQEADPWRNTTEPKSLGTIDLVQELRARYPSATFSFLLGSDAFGDLLLGKWKESARLLEVLEFHVIAREGWEHVDMRKAPAPPKCNVYVIPGLTDISSTFVRARTTSWRAQHEVYPAVYQYLREHGLYGFSKPEQIRLLLRMTITTLFTVGTLAYGLFWCRTPALQPSTLSSAVDGNRPAVASGIKKVGGWVKNMLEQGKPTDK